ncbi:hypothetical protein MLD38_021392 [Melastoma candidum]|uniref:Uncharacterized protein n=1 Tax=Melastoma candidum TaxID=119954 RepID=A0ACB9QGG6_9MYRT|nr:hypothetical protein MLD38_021392 [Melastoma candidum]
MLIGSGKGPSLMDLCVRKIAENIVNYSTFSMIPRDISQLIFNEMVNSQRLSQSCLEAFRDCAIQDMCLGDALKDCKNLQSLNFNFCELISDVGLAHLSGLNVFFLDGLLGFCLLHNDSFRSHLGMHLDLERCPKIHNGLIHIQGLSKLESLNIKWCNSITDADMKHLAGLTSLKSLQISCSKVTDSGIAYLKALQKLSLLNLEGCLVTAACLDSLAALSMLLYLNLNRCRVTDDGSDKFARLGSLKVLNLGFNDITDACLKHLKGLTNLESLNLDSCRIKDAGLINLAGLRRLKCLELSDTEIGSGGLHHLSGLTNLQSINLSFTGVTDGGLRKPSGLSTLKSLNLDARQITDSGLAARTNGETQQLPVAEACPWE